MWQKAASCALGEGRADTVEPVHALFEEQRVARFEFDGVSRLCIPLEFVGKWRMLKFFLEKSLSAMAVNYLILAGQSEEDRSLRMAQPLERQRPQLMVVPEKS